MADGQSKSDAALREERILDFWEKEGIFEKTLSKSSPKGEFVFYEGPPTANGKPGVHHLESRSFKDAIPRYKTMRGYHVPRRAGWDTHGLPVELEVEKELGFSGKKQIESYGVAAFNKKCRESVHRYIEVWGRFTKRMGYWVDQDKAYYTFNASYMESLFAIVKKIEHRLFKDYRVVPWCVSCGTALSSHELAQGYEDVKDLSLTAKFELVDEPGTFLLAWTTTPWTLPGNVALAVGPGITYARYVKEGEKVIIAEALAARLGEGWHQEAEMLGADLVGKQYRPLYPFTSKIAEGDEKERLANAYKVYAADFVTTEDGTGIVHTAVMYGADDFELGKKTNLPRVHLVAPDGRFIAGTGFLEGKSVIESETNVEVLKDLQARNAYFSKENYGHSYPHCWRSKNRLIYYARDSWYIRMQDLRDTLIASNKSVQWEPSHIRDGRMGEWLLNVKDWAISRERYWGTPLPVWESAEGDRIVIGSLKEMESLLVPDSSLPKNEQGEIDLHRPYIDEVILQKDGKEYRRVKEVMDVWFDSGSMPYAQDHVPFSKNAATFPADFISEAMDQTRGWFYTLLAVATLLGKSAPYKNVICLGHLLDAEGKKMSKSKGNVIEPFAAMDEYGADTLRYWMYYVNQPGDSKNFDPKTVKEVARVMSWLDNSAKFYELFRGASETNGKEEVIDRWIKARVNETVAGVTEAMEGYRPYDATRTIAGLLDDLSTWYVRRVRDRVRDGDPAALATLRATLRTSALLIAPFAPFIAEDVWQMVKEKNDAESVHLAEWPKAQTSFLEQFTKSEAKEVRAMLQVRSLASEALKLRQQANKVVRQPLASLSIPGALSKELQALLADEVNVKEIKQNAAELKLDTELTLELILEGDEREKARAVADARKQMNLSPKDTVTVEWGSGPYSVELSTGPLSFSVILNAS